MSMQRCLAHGLGGAKGWVGKVITAKRNRPQKLAENVSKHHLCSEWCYYSEKSGPVESRWEKGDLKQGGMGGKGGFLHSV